MDSTSIITQASRDDGELLATFPSTEKGKGKFFHKWRSAGSDVTRQGGAGGVGVGPSSYKKPRHRGLLCSLLCCLKAPSSQTNGTVQRLDSSPKLPAKYLLPPACHQDARKKCMVIDLDETLVHSSFKPIANADFIVPVEIDGAVHQVYVQKRPYVDEFLQKVGELYECVLFTASLAKYADPVADLLDKWGVFRARLFRESCVLHQGNYVKDLGRLGRDLQKVIIVDNSPASYIFHPDNAVAVASWFDDASDTELRDLVPFFENLSRMENVYSVLRNSNHVHHHHHLHSLPSASTTATTATVSAYPRLQQLQVQAT